MFCNENNVVEPFLMTRSFPLVSKFQSVVASSVNESAFAFPNASIPVEFV